jgi:hypothetical protein
MYDNLTRALFQVRNSRKLCGHFLFCVLVLFPDAKGIILCMSQHPLTKIRPRPGYTLPLGHKTHPGWTPAPAYGLFLKYPSSHGSLEHDRQRSLVFPPEFLHMPRSRNQSPYLYTSKAFPCYPPSARTRNYRAEPFLCQCKVNHSFLLRQDQKPHGTTGAFLETM